MFEGITTFFRKVLKPGQTLDETSKDTAKERLHLVLMQDRANVSADFLDLMKQEIIEVIKKYVEVDEKEIDVRLTNQSNEDGTNGAPALYANIPIINIKNDVKGEKMREKETEEKAKKESKSEDEKSLENAEKNEKKNKKNIKKDTKDKSESIVDETADIAAEDDAEGKDCVKVAESDDTSDEDSVVDNNSNDEE